MNILIINDFGIKGAGTENRLSMFINQLLNLQKFNEIHLLEHEISQSPEINGVVIHRCSTKNSGEVVKKIIRDNSIDIIQVHNLAHISVRPIVVAKKLKKFVVFSAHDQWGYCGRRVLIDKQGNTCSGPGFVKCVSCIGFKNFLNIQKNKFYLNKCDFGIAPSQFVINMYERNGILNNKWIKIFPWTDFTHNLLNRKNYLLYVGGLEHYKGINFLLESMCYVIKECPDIKLKIVGPGDSFRFEAMINKFKLNNNVEFLGYKNKTEIEYLMQECYLFILPSICEESSSLSVIQAMLSGCAIISTNTGGVPEMLADVGMIVAKHDVLDLSKAIISLIKNPLLAEDYRLKAKIRGQNLFDLKNIDKWIRLYDRFF